MSYRFTKRTGGYSHGAFASLNLALHVGDDESLVAQNRALADKYLSPVQYMNQVHGNRIAIIEEQSEEAPTADALVTGIPGITLGVMVADCIPLLLHSKEIVAAVHVGRQGLMNSVTQLTIELMREMGASTIQAVIGPSICGRCYEVSEDVYHEVIAEYPTAKSTTARGTLSLDLPEALRHVLAAEAVGVLDEFSCTFEDPELFSYRRDGVTGRQAGLIRL
jgi:YfiH family protein